MPADLNAHIAELESLGLIRPVLSDTAPEYRFRHALVHDAAYTTMLRQDRRRLHQAVGEVLESEPASAGDDLDAVLARHFFEAGDLVRATRYFGQAGRSAAHMYAHAEALAYYSQAIETARQAAAQSARADSNPLANLLRGRARVFELQGSFENARADFEQSVEAARLSGSQLDEWKAILGLALLWSQRDYDRAGQYCHVAVELAEAMGDPLILASSYNRLGNWRLNIEQPREAAEYHERALAIFQSLGNEAGMAETLDLLGMSSMLGARLARGAAYFQQAIELNRRLGDRLALANCLASQLLTATCTYQTLTMSPSPLAGLDLTEQGRQALRIMQESGWRAGEAFVDFIQAYYALSHGHYAEALAAAAAEMQVANSIAHRQWQASSHYLQGTILFDLLDYSGAGIEFETGLALSQQIGSQHWVSTHLGTLGWVQVEAGGLEQAGRTLARAGHVSRPPQSAGQRLIWYALARLALAQNRLDEALEMVADLTGSAESPEGEARAISAWLLLLRGSILDQLGRAAEAEADFRAGAAAASQNNERPSLWRLWAALAKLLEARGHAVEADEARRAARRLVADLAAEVPDIALREQFQSAAQGML